MRRRPFVSLTPDNEDNNDEARMHTARDPCRYVLGLESTAPPGQEFFYNTGALTLVSAIVRKATGRTLDEFARATLFEPLGITGEQWIRFKGDSDAGGGLRLRPRDMAKIGQLVLAGGRWNVPELDLVVAVTAGYCQDYSPRAFQLQYGIFRDVLQAISPPS